MEFATFRCHGSFVNYVFMTVSVEVSRYANNGYWLREIKYGDGCRRRRRKYQFAAVDRYPRLTSRCIKSRSDLSQWRIHFTSTLSFVGSSFTRGKALSVSLPRFHPFFFLSYEKKKTRLESLRAGVRRVVRITLRNNSRKGRFLWPR